MTIQFARATRRATKLKIGVDGPSGSGKTLGALALADGITRGGKIAVADSENGSASLYADRYQFDTVAIPDADPETYKAIITAAAEAEYEALVIDSLSHAWLYVLAAKEDYDRQNPKSNSWTNWRKFGPQWDGLMQHILHAPLHIIATMRSKQAYEQVDTGGKKQVVKLGLQPQVRDGAEYEFGIVFSVNQAHRAEATKDRTALFADQLLDLCDPALHQSLVGWMNAGGADETRPGHATPAPARASLSNTLGNTLATHEQKARIAALLDAADITDELREKYAARAGRQDLSAQRASEIIAGLEKLVPQIFAANTGENGALFGGHHA